MTRTALTLLAGILGATCVACVQVLLPPPPEPRIDARCRDGSTFISRVALLQANYHPKRGSSGNPSSAPYTGTGPVRDDLNAAFASGPPWFQDHLCSLTAIYLNPASGSQVFHDSWGFRRKRGTNGEETYVAISLGLWSNGIGAPAVPLAHYQNTILQDYA